MSTLVRLLCQHYLTWGSFANVLGVDPDIERCDLAKSFGVKTLKIGDSNDQVKWSLNLTKNIGVDGAIITAATNSLEPINLAAKACRKRGRIVLLGVTGLNFRRDLFYKKELSITVSC